MAKTKQYIFFLIGFSGEKIIKSVIKIYFRVFGRNMKKDFLVMLNFVCLCTIFCFFTHAMQFRKKRKSHLALFQLCISICIFLKNLIQILISFKLNIYCTKYYRFNAMYYRQAPTGSTNSFLSDFRAII